jgi:hypothetical protein
MNLLGAPRQLVALRVMAEWGIILADCLSLVGTSCWLNSVAVAPSLLFVGRI